mmetsp:Transcript_89588/g.191977  ORF Transcript_89588/g.191977 Transcript_89588/m.191977 type:complete len:246 (-) Transcript_89588:455-1192(-)
MTLVVDVNELPEILDGLLCVLVVHCENEVKERLVVHLALTSLSIPVGLIFLEDSVDEDVREHAAAEAAELVLAQHPVLVNVELQVGPIDLESRLHAEPIGLSLRGPQGLLLSQLIQLKQDLRREEVADLDPASALHVEEEEELPDSREDIEGVELLLERVELRQRGDKLENEVLHILLSEVAATHSIVVAQLHPRLLDAHLADHKGEEGHDGDATVLVPREFQKGGGAEELPEALPSLEQLISDL